MNLFDDTTARKHESSLETMTPEHDNHTGGSAVIDAPEHAQPSPAQPLASAPEVRENGAPQNDAPETSTHENTAAGSDDFAAALEHFETETEGGGEIIAASSGILVGGSLRSVV